MTARTLLLTERVTTRCRLSPTTVEFLLTQHGRHLQLLPTSRKHVYRLTPSGRVGTIDAPGCRVVIQPKIPLRNLFFLLDPEGVLPPRTGTEVDDEHAVLEWLAVRLAGLLAERVAAGLQRGYAERQVQGLYLQGRLDVSAQLRETRREQLHSRHDDFTPDVPCNQAARAAGLLLADCPLVSESARQALRRALTGFGEVRTLPLTPLLVELALAGRVPAGYTPLLELCGVLAHSQARGSAPAFLVDLERVFEGYVTQGVQKGLAGVESLVVASQRTQRFPGEGTEGCPDLSLRPDVTIDRAGKPAVVLDVKWKRLPTSPVVEDVYQVAAYCTALGAPRGVLVYPGGQRERVWEYSLGDVRLTVRTLDVRGEPARCTRALKRLGKWLRVAATEPRPW